MSISVIMPARDAAATIARPLDSLAAQTLSDWELLVVDDGSVDHTAAVVAARASGDGRIRLLHESGRGPAAARNLALERAAGSWVLFLDADDAVPPDHLERLAGAVAAGGHDCAYCANRVVDEAGTVLQRRAESRAGDLFPLLARYPVFDIHACLVRAAVLHAVGRFDERLEALEDWDLWARVARAGARFAAVPGLEAITFARSGSLSADPRRMLSAGLEVVRRTHAADPRVAEGPARYSSGMPRGDLPGASFMQTCWPAGLLIAAGEDPRGVLASLPQGGAPRLDAAAVADTIFHALARAAPAPPPEWLDRVEDFRDGIDTFLDALEAASGAPRLANRAWTHLLRRALDARSPGATGAPRGSFREQALMPVDLEDCAGDIVAPGGAEVARVALLLRGRLAGSTDLPFVGGRIRADVLRDALPDGVIWAILREFLEEAAYRDPRRIRRLLELTDPEPAHAPAPGPAEPSFAALHERVGWTAFLQEFWGIPDWPAGAFYDPGREPAAERYLEAEARAAWFEIELTGDLPVVLGTGGSITLIPLVGGHALGQVEIALSSGRASPQAIRAAVCSAAGFELARRAVLLGVLPFLADGAARETLRRRLQSVAARARADSPYDTDLSPASSRLAATLLEDAEPTVLVGRRDPRRIAGGRERRATIPAVAAHDLLRTERACGTPVVEMAGAAEGRPQVVVVPELVAARAARARPRLISRLLPGGAGAEDHRESPVAGVGMSPRLPILLYRRVCPPGLVEHPLETVSPEAFSDQLLYLRSSGYRTATLREWAVAQGRGRPLPGRRLIMTFEVPPAEFERHAWPALRRQGFSALLLVSRPVSGWKALRRMMAQGLTIGWRGGDGGFLSALGPADQAGAAAAARREMLAELGVAPAALAYAPGDDEPAIGHVMAAAGFAFGLTSRAGHASLEDDAMALPRLEVTGAEEMAQFIDTVTTAATPPDDST